ncbi:UNVERIFIED_CONTAM: Cyclin-SDS [Sesamum latifolium]|uniref:Cyclin-SDS n=1 Tax=Sesamum latifolium TaxID=2727402 RepID=A0AAW2WYF6_9LAMI
MKRKLKAKAVAEVEASLGEQQPLYFTRKQLRSRFSRRRRVHISPIVLVSGTDSHVTAASEISCDSSIASVSNQNPPDLSEFRRVVTRAYYRKNFKKENRNCDEVLELSDTSCVESSSRPNRDLSLKSGNVERLEVKGGEVAKSEVTSTSRFSFRENDAGKVKENDNSVQITRKDVLSEIPGRDKIFCEEITNSEAGKCILLDNKDVSIHSVQRSINISENRAMSEELRLPKLALDVDLSCSEQFSNVGVINNREEEEEHNSSSSQIFQVVSDSELESSEYSPSFWSYASGSQFSEKSIGDESSSPTFELFRQFKQQFCRSTFDLKACDDHNSHEINEYCNTTEYGELVIQQRLHMVHWIVEQARNKELQKETLFLGVNLLDRFLSKGYFKNMRNLQIAGIACLTLATRIEETKPYNCIRKKTFSVGSTLYVRCEVVAMEWLIQEVLNFQCFLPTLYNFLWFYLKAARANEDVEKTAKYLAVLTLMGRQQLCYCPSTVAAGLVIVASVATNQDASCHLVATSLEWLVKYL